MRPLNLRADEVHALLASGSVEVVRAISPQPVIGICDDGKTPSCGFPGKGLRMRGGGHVFIDNTASQRWKEDCAPHKPNDACWVREPFWASNDSDTDGYRTFDCGSSLSLGKEYCNVQYCGSPKNPDEPNEPGDWWEAPPPGRDSYSDYHGTGTMTWTPWGLFTKHSAAQMPRWASRLTVEVVYVAAVERDGWQWATTVRRINDGRESHEDQQATQPES